MCLHIPLKIQDAEEMRNPFEKIKDNLTDYFFHKDSQVRKLKTIVRMYWEVDLSHRPLVFLLRNQVLALSGLPCMLLPVSPLLPLRFSLSWNFAILIMMCLEVGLFGFLLIGTLCVSWICVIFISSERGNFLSLLF